MMLIYGASVLFVLAVMLWALWKPVSVQPQRWEHFD
jgi:type II secretory pathway component PulM